MNNCFVTRLCITFSSFVGAQGSSSSEIIASTLPVASATSAHKPTLACSSTVALAALSALSSSFPLTISTLIRAFPG